jgi:hypothetical protein
MKPPQSALSQEFSFRVTGTNTTLQQPVIFTGRWSPPTNLPASMQSTNGVSGAILLGRQVSAPGPTFVPSYRILGSVVLKDGEAIPINAVSTPP